MVKVEMRQNCQTKEREKYLIKFFHYFFHFNTYPDPTIIARRIGFKRWHTAKVNFQFLIVKLRI